MIRLAIVGLSLLLALPLLAEPEQRTLNNGNLVLEDVPEIPQEISDQLKRYQNTRSAGFLDWTGDGESIFITTRFGNTNQIHRVDDPGAARQQLTFFDEPVFSAARQPGHADLLFSMDEGGSEYSQLFLMDTDSGESTRLTDGESRNMAPQWSDDGSMLAFTSTRRNGASNDIWLLSPDAPEDARMLLESGDGSAWYSVDFSDDGSELLVLNYVGNMDSWVVRLDVASGERSVEQGGGDNPTRNFPIAFDKVNGGYFFTSDRNNGFMQLYRQPADAEADPVLLTGDINWDVEGMALSEDGTRAAFTVNENGASRIYLMDPASGEYRQIDAIPVGIVGGLKFSPDGDQLAMTLNSASTPSDVFVLDLGQTALESGELIRWTTSEVGGLDTSRFISPNLVEYPTFDEVDGEPRMIPAYVYTPPGDGPHPVVVSIHGGPEGQFRPRFSSTYQAWLDNGFAVIAPNVRGSSGYGREYLQLDNAMKREDSVRDIGALLEWIAEQPDLNSDAVAVFGGSYGGYMVLASAVHYSDRLAAAVDIVGISNFVTFLKNTKDYRRDLRRVEYGDERDPEMEAFLQDISPSNNVEKIRIPVFVIQGNNDPRVPVSEAEQIVEALRDNGQTVWYMNALDEGHGYRKKENRDVLSEAVLMFFQKHLHDDILHEGVDDAGAERAEAP